MHLERARAAPGVAGALSSGDVRERVAPLSPRLEGEGFWSTAWRPLAPERVRFVGEPVAAFCAETAAQAADACELAEVDYEPLPAITCLDAALAPGAALLHEDVPGNVLFRRDRKSVV